MSWIVASIALAAALAADPSPAPVPSGSSAAPASSSAPASGSTTAGVSTTTGDAQVVVIDPKSFKPAEGPDSGPAVYYQVVEDPEGPLLRASYRPGMESVTMGVEVPEQLRAKAKRLRWRWRVRAFPVEGNDCGGPGDSAAAVFVTFKRGLKWYIIKYGWSTVGKRFTTCDPRRNLTLARDTVLFRVGGDTGTWNSEEIDLAREYRRHFSRGRNDGDVPDFVGIGVLSDGDQTNSPASADYAGFEIEY